MLASNSLDDFDMSDSSDTTKSSFRISVCLKRYFTDVRALCFVLITRKRNVKWLERKIQKLFNLHGRFYLTSHGHLLPSSERLGLLHPDDIVEVIPQELASQFSEENEGPCSLSNNLNGIGKDMPDTGPKPQEITSQFSQQNEGPCSLSNNLNAIGKDMPDTGPKPQEITSQFSQQNEGLCSQSNNLNAIGKDMADTGPKQRLGSFSECTLTTYENRDPIFVEKNNESQKGLEIEENVAQDNISNKPLQSNVHKETHKENDILQQVKQNALALLDNRYSCITADLSQTADNNLAIPRKRKRVRRKRQLVLSSPITQKSYEETTVSPHEALNNITEDSLNTYSADHERDTCISDESSLTISTFVARNEVSSVRKPRIVRSIIDTS